MATGGSEWIKVTSAETGLFKVGEPRDVVVSYDGAAGEVSLKVDGKVVGAADFDGTMGTGDYHRMSFFTIGDKWGAQELRRHAVGAQDRHRKRLRRAAARARDGSRPEAGAQAAARAHPCAAAEA